MCVPPATSTAREKEARRVASQGRARTKALLGAAASLSLSCKVLGIGNLLPPRSPLSHPQLPGSASPSPPLPVPRARAGVDFKGQSPRPARILPPSLTP